MPQILIPPKNISNGYFRIEGDEAHHLIRVLRKKENDIIDGFDGAGRQFKGVLNEVGEHFVEGKVIEEKKSTPPRPKIVLYQGLPKGSKFDYIIEKSVELGVDVIVPFVSRKNPNKVTSNRASKQNRWNSLALAASKQSQRAFVPEIRPVLELVDFTAHFSHGLSIVLDPGSKEKISTLIPRIKGELDTINIVIGPESGFLSEEINMIRNSGVIPVSLGEQILRTETAGLAVLAILNYELGRY